MATLAVYWSPDPDALLGRAAAPFVTAGLVAEPLPLLAVRQGGIRDAVHDLAASAGCHGWLGKQLVVFQELPQLLAGDVAPLTTFERRAIVERILRERALPLLATAARSRRVAQELDSLLGELIAAEIPPDRLPDMLDRAGRDAWMCRRDAELSVLYASYHSTLAALPKRDGITRSDGRDGLLQAARAVRTEPAVVQQRLRRPFDSSGAKRSIDIYGLADLRRGWGALIDALHGASFIEELRLYVVAGADPTTLDADDFRSQIASPADRVELIPPGERSVRLAHLRSSLFQPMSEVAASGEDVRGLAAPDMQRELESVVRRVKRLITDDGVAPRDIAIVARQARPYANRAVELLTVAGVPATASLRHTLSDVPALRMLLRIFTAAGSGWSVRALEQLGASPYLDIELDTALLTQLRGEARPQTVANWEGSVALAMRNTASNSDPEDDRLQPLRIERLQQQMSRFAAGAKPVEAARSLSEWIALTLCAVACPRGNADAPQDWDDGIFRLAVNAVAPCDPSVDADAATLLTDALRLDDQALRELVLLLHDWRSSLNHLDPTDNALASKLSPTDWARELEAVLGDEEVSLGTSQRQGVQVVEALAAAGRTFDHVFVVGMSSGSFPAEPSLSPFFPDSECAELHGRGLPFEAAATWFEREATLFRSLVGSARRSLTLSYSYADGSGAPQLASAYYDETASRFSVDADGAGWEVRTGGSERLPTVLGDVWSSAELAMYAAHAWRTGSTDAELGIACSALAHLTRGLGQRRLVTGTLHAAHVENQRVRGRAVNTDDRASHAHPWNGAIEDSDALALLGRRLQKQIWSATALEKYGRCGFSYLGQHFLNADELCEEDGDESAAERGSLVHAILADVYSSLAQTLGDEPIHSADPAAVATLVEGAVARALASEAIPVPPNEGLRIARTAQLTGVVQEYVTWEMQQSAKGKPSRRPLYIELGFGSDGDDCPPIEFEVDGRSFQLRGRIDRVDAITNPEASGYYYLVDHKMGGSSLSPLGVLRDAGALLQLHLYMAALVRIMDDDRIFGGAYQLITGLESTGGLNRASFVTAGFKIEGNDTQRKAAELVRRAPELAMRLIDGMTAGKFAARTPGSTKCLTYCGLRSVCREPNMAEYRP
ncbi:MAG: PD-(D/E)XK nuclease family protein [Gemmatimonadaceae bacterium]